MAGFWAQPGSEAQIVDLEALVEEYHEKGIEDVDLDLGDMLFDEDLV